MTLNYQKLLEDIVKSLVLFPNDVTVTLVEKEEEKFLDAAVKVNEKDLGRVIGHKGHTINSIRSIFYAVVQKDDLKIKIEVLAN